MCSESRPATAAARILWIASFEPGSWLPALPLALELARRGHRLTVLSEPAARETVESVGLGFRPTETLAAALAGFDADAHGGGRLAKHAWHELYVRALFADATNALAAARYDLALVDPLEPGGDFAAEAAGVPSVTYVHWRMDETGVDVPFRFHFWDGERPAEEAFVEWWNAQRALVGLEREPRPLEESRWYRHSRLLTLILGLPELAEPKGKLPPYALRVGPTGCEPSDEPPPAWLAEVGCERPAVLASVSTTGRADAELLGLVAEAALGEELDVVATVPVDGGLPELPPNVRLAPFVPHGLLLPHVAAVVTHGGNGTVTRAACAGVPLLLLPAGKDQFEVARGAAAAGIAIALDRSAAGADEARRALRSLVRDPGYRLRARRIAARATAYDAPTAAADAIDALLA